MVLPPLTRILVLPPQTGHGGGWRGFAGSTFGDEELAATGGTGGGVVHGPGAATGQSATGIPANGGLGFCFGGFGLNEPGNGRPRRILARSAMAFQAMARRDSATAVFTSNDALSPFDWSAALNVMAASWMRS